MTRAGFVARTVRDATRFTSTTPSVTAAHSAPTPRTAKSLARAVFSSLTPPPRPARAAKVPGESPEERVARLRRAHDAARNAQVSTVDKAIVAGRSFADRVHRATIFLLMSFTGQCLLDLDTML